MIESVARATWALDFRGKARLIRALPVHGRRQFRLPWGAMELDLDQRTQRDMAFGIYDRREIRLVQHLVREGQVALDVGAHVGFYTVLLGSLVGPAGRVVAVEPVPSNFAALQRNVALNSFDGVHLVQAAASERNGTARLSTQEGETGWGSLEISRSGPAVEVGTIRLDEYLNDLGVASLGFAKIDVEGHELSVLRGLEKFLDSPGGPSLMVEMLAERAESSAATLSWLKDRGYLPKYVKGRAGRLRHNVFFEKPKRAQ
jgi:FkbM family methyltransferase